MAKTRTFPGLDDTQSKFIQNLAMGMSKTAAAKHAGVSSPSKYANTQLRRKEVVTQLNVLYNENRQVMKMTRAKVEEGLLEAIDMARLQADPVAMIRGFQEINKMCGFYAPQEKKITLTMNQSQTLQDMDELSDEQLLTLHHQLENEDAIDAEFTEIADAAHTSDSEEVVESDDADA